MSVTEWREREREKITLCIIECRIGMVNITISLANPLIIIADGSS